MKTFIVLIFVSFHAFANDMRSLTDLMREIRDPDISPELRRESLVYVREKMQKILSEELKVPSSELPVYFGISTNRLDVLKRSSWQDLQTEFYASLHQVAYSSRFEEAIKHIKISEFGKSLHENMLAQWGDYSPVEEGRSYLRLHQNHGARIPFFLMSSNLEDLLRNDSIVPYEELLGTDLSHFQKLYAGLNVFEKNELAERIVLNRKIALRAMGNAVKTIVSIYHLTNLMNEEDTSQKITSFLDKHCTFCSNSEKKEIKKSAFAYASIVRPTIQSKNMDEIAKNFCKSLRKNDYHWNIDKMKPAPVELLQDSSKMADYYLYHKLHNKNKEAIAKTILEQDFGVLFITNAINVLDKSKEPVGTNLACIPQSKDQDRVFIRLAIEEGYKNVIKYVTEVNKLIHKEKETIEEAKATLNFFVQTNQAATAEALTAFPQGISHVLKSIAELDHKIDKRRKLDKVVTWGGTIVGLGLIATGAFAPEGVAIYVSLAWITKGLTQGSYYYVRSKQERLYFDQMLLAYQGTGKVTQEVLREHFKEYKHLKVEFVKEMGATVLDFYELHKVALELTRGDILKAHSLLQKLIKGGKTIALYKAKDKLIELYYHDN